MASRDLKGEFLGVEGGIATVAVTPRTDMRGVRQLGIRLDGRLAGSVAVTLAGRGRRVNLRIPLPTHCVAERFDLVDPLSGRSLLAAPADLRAVYGLVIEPLRLEGTVVSGRFTVRPELDQVLAATLLMNDAPAGEVLASRVDPGGTRGADRIYQFRADIPALCPFGVSYVLGLQIGGITAAVPPLAVTVTSEDVGFVGYIDRCDNGLVAGWATNLKDPAHRVDVDLVKDGEILTSVLADSYREDIAATGITDGKSAFGFTVPHVGRGEASVPYHVRLAGTRTELCGSPAALGPSLRLIGFFDAVEGGIAIGWICDLDRPDTRIEVELVCGDTILGRGVADGLRGDVLAAGIPIGNCGFRISLGNDFRERLGREVYIRPVGIPIVLAGSPRTLTENPLIGRFLTRSTRLDEARFLRVQRRFDHRLGTRALSIVMPVYNTRQDWLLQAIESVRHQWCGNWELICVDDNSTEPHVGRILAAYAQHEPRIRVLRSPRNVGIAGATNFGIRAARHDYVTFMDHDDYLEPDAAYCLLRAAAETGADFLYSDEVLTNEDLDSIFEVRARPAFSHDYYLSHPYFVHMLCVKTELARRIGGWDEAMSISADIDFVLRVIELAGSIAHVPAVLYRWRTHASSTGHSKQSQVMDASRGAIARHLTRTGSPATVSDGVFFNQFRLDWPADDGEILIVIPTKNKADLLRTCIDSIEKTAKGVNYRIVVIDHQSEEPASQRYLRRIASRHIVMPYAGEFNFARMNNVAVRSHGAGAKYILFLNNDIEATEPGWLDQLRSLANRPEVGAVGPLLLYGDKRVQHGGVIIGFNNAAEHVQKFVDGYIEGGPRRNLGYNCTLSSVRAFSAVTAACMLLRHDVFEQVGGFDEIFAIGFNDTDLCLRIGAAGYKVLYDGRTMLFHHESATRSLTKQVIHPKDDRLLRRRWRRYFVEGDPFYNPILDLRVSDHTLRTDGDCRRVPKPRVTLLAPASSRRKRRREAAETV